MGRAERAWFAIIVAIEIAVIVALFARTDPHYPAGFGFDGTRDQWQLFWITFWSSAFPTIATATIITVLAGRYLNDRERRLDRHREEQMRTQRHGESMEWLQHRLVRDLDESVDIRFSDSPTARDALSPRMQAVHETLASQPWPLWRQSLPGMGLLFVRLYAVDEAYRRCARLADLFDRDLHMAVRFATQRVAFGLADSDGQRLSEQMTRMFIIGRAIGQAPNVQALSLAGDLRYEAPLMKAWASAQAALPEITDSATHFGQAYAELTDALTSLQASIRTVMGQDQDQAGGSAENAPS